MIPPEPLRQLRDLNKASPKFHEQLSNFFRGDVYRNVLPHLSGDNLAWLVEYLDGVLVDTPSHASMQFQESLYELGKICGMKEVLPKSCTLSESLLGCVYEGTFDGSKVRVRRLRMYPGGDPRKVKEIFHQMAAMSKYLDHPNIVPLLGVTTEPLELISDWMPGGDLLGYIATHPDADKFALLSDVADGLNYLHSCNMVHGDLKGSNILVDATGHARITDFGLAIVTQGLDSVRNASVERGKSVQWIAPEILDNRGTYSKEADIFSFAGVAIEAFTGAAPFGDKSPRAAISAIKGGERPPRPADPTLTDSFWALIRECWSPEAHLRPHVLRIPPSLGIPAWKRLIDPHLDPDERTSLVTDIFSDRNETEVVKYLRGQDAQSFVDVIDEMLDSLAPWLRRECLRTLCRICGREALLPRSVQIPPCYNQTGAPLYYGGFSEVWKGRHEGREVAVKVLRVRPTSGPDKVMRRFCKEVLTWRALCHPNVLPLLGVTMGERFEMVSEWMENGNITEFIKRNRDVNRLRLLVGVAQGLIYMHDEGIIHGDLKGANILVDKRGRACLADFGLVTIVSDPASTTMSTSAKGGTTRWMSPELLDPGQLGLKNSQPTRESDCYALGMVIYEVLSGQVPFASCNVGFIVSRKIVEGERPERPSGLRGMWFTDDLWALLEWCWSAQPQNRPTTEVVLEHLEQASGAWQPLSPNARDAVEEDGYTSTSAMNYHRQTTKVGGDITPGPLKSRSPGAVDLGPDSDGPHLATNGPGEMQDAPPFSPVATTTNNIPALISLIANWDGESQDASEILTTVFEAEDYMDCIENLPTTDIDPLSFVNNLDKMIDSLTANSDLWRRCTEALCVTCGIYGILPASHAVTFMLTEPRGEPFRSNHFSDLWKLADVNDLNRVFAVKSFHVLGFHSPEWMNKTYCWEATVSKQMKHPNILSIEGVVPRLSRFCVVSEWMVNGNIMEYVRKYRKVNRLDLLIGVTSGLSYLHKNLVVHGRLKSSNILIDAMGSPRISGFSLFDFFIGRFADPIDAPIPDYDFGIRYIAPELLCNYKTMEVKYPVYIYRCDVYSLSMIITELATGQTPFSGYTDRDVTVMVSSGKRPPKPRRFEAPGITPEVWSIAETCWHERAEERPNAEAVLQNLQQIASRNGIGSSLKQRWLGIFV